MNLIGIGVAHPLRLWSGVGPLEMLEPDWGLVGCYVAMASYF